MVQPNVSLLMPVYNSFSLERSDGKQLLPLALTALLNQTFRDFELIILDNQSTDDTPRICKAYAAQDARIRYVVDDRKRFAEEAIGHLAGMATAPYSLIVNDDDIWEKSYLERAVAYLDTHPDVDLVYGKAIFIDVDDRIVGMYAAPRNERYTADLPALAGFMRYIQFRNVLPINFGLFRTEVFQAILPYEDFDTLKSNVDNALMSNFFLKGFTAYYSPDLIFLYRRKSRKLNPPGFAKDMPPLTEPIGIWLFYVRHQLLFHAKIMAFFERAYPREERRDTIVRFAVLASCIRYCFDLLRWLQTELAGQGMHAESRKVAALIRECGDLRRDLARYPNLEALTAPDVDSAAVEATVQETVRVFEALLEKASRLEESATTRELLDQVRRMLADIVPQAGQPAAALAALPRGRAGHSLYSLREFFKDHPRLKAYAFFARSVLLNLRFLSLLLYMRFVQKQAKSVISRVL